MKTIKKYFIKSTYIFFTVTLLIILSCQDFLEVDQPLGEIKHELVFNDESTATASVTTLYYKLNEDVLVNGNLYGLASLMGLYSDELVKYEQIGNDFDFFYTHQILPENSVVTSVWNSSYKLIFLCNSILEGLENSPNISESTKNQLIGETIFVRSLVYFYLINLFGDIPYTTSTDYKINMDLERINEDLVYSYITEDLMEARLNLSTEYVTGERVRANRFVVSALLARVFLYTENWQLADFYASEVINSSDLYNMETDISKEFLFDSPSAILQLKQMQGLWTSEASNFIFEFGPPPIFSLNPNLAESFEEGDLRRTYWVKELIDVDQTWYMSNKYKRFDFNGPEKEYSIVFRLAEQFLIRAEAKLKLGNLSGAAEDINHIRNRAGLSPVSMTEDLNDILIQERKAELFCEHGHRWFDLKRWGIAQEILSPIKPNWRETDILLPIPQTELELNPNLQPQNPGY